MGLLEVTGDNFEDEVLNADRPVLVDFWGPRCQPCIALMPAVEALAEQYEEQIKVVKVNASIRPNWRLSGELKVLGLPAYLFFENGREIKRITGDGLTAASLNDAVKQLIASSQKQADGR